MKGTGRAEGTLATLASLLEPGLEAKAEKERMEQGLMMAESRDSGHKALLHRGRFIDMK